MCQDVWGKLRLFFKTKPRQLQKEEPDCEEPWACFPGFSGAAALIKADAILPQKL